ncbi:MAG: nuclease-related domain-containing protein [Limisphaerales bacterium]
MNITILSSLVSLVPPVFVMAIAMIWVWRLTRGSRVPVKDTLLRAPGETLRSHMEKFDRDMPDYIILLLFYGPVCLAFWVVFRQLRAKSPHLPAETAAFLALVVIVSLVIARKIVQALLHQRNLFLGFRGERAVGEELNRLMLDGCLVFHDVPGAGDWNVDHVVVAPSGVYAIETKTRRKGKCLKGKRDYEVVYDGNTLEYPHCRDTHGIDQANANAKWLSRHLGNAIAERIWVTPILTLPGWLVTSRVKPRNGELLVVNHKQFRSVIVEVGERVLNDKQIKQIGYQLELKCRDVEF